MAKSFRGKLTRGTLRRDTVTATDNSGDPTARSTATFEFHSGIRESFSASFMVRAGIPETDVSILILLGSLNPETVPKADDLIYLRAPWNVWHKCRRVLEIDPAGASARLQVYEIPTPED